MRMRQLGNSGLTVSIIGLGANNFGWRLDVEKSRPVIEEAIESGINFIDTSDSYDTGNSETILGEVLKGRREDVVIATKFGSNMGGSNGPDWGARASRRYVNRAVEASLRRLQTDWIDLYQLHRLDGVTPHEETLDALDDLVRQGKIRYAGRPTSRHGMRPRRTGYQRPAASLVTSQLRTTTRCSSGRSSSTSSRPALLTVSR
jgi:aryl-alcohol dehydrogenase-like predicted oxidoreductase